MKKGFSVLEVVLAAAVFMYFGVASVVVVLSALNANRLGSEQTVASQFASEGIEIVRSIKNKSFTNLTDTAGSGLTFTGGVWTFSGANNTLTHNSTDNYVRVITVATAQRDASGNIVASGGTADQKTKKVTSTVSWNFNSARPESVIFTTYFTNWKNKKGGLLVYGNGATTADAISYRLFDANTNAWGAATAAFDVDGATANKALRALRLYSSVSRDEKVAISRHYNGSAQFIYATIWNGSSWGTPLQLSTWTAATFLDVTNFDGTYLANGDFMVVYSDNTTTPKFRVWNGTAWTAQTSSQNAGGIPNFIVASARPGTNEVMVAVFDQLIDTNTQYFNGGSYVVGSWTAHTEHAAAAPSNTRKMVDFTWSPNTTTTGALVYANTATDKALTVRIFLANGTGGGAWGTAANAGTAQTNNMGALALTGRLGANEFHACNKDTLATPTIVCRKFTFAGSTPTISNPTNPIIAGATDTGIERSYDIGFESVSGTPALAVYSDNTASPKLKKYTAATSTWDAAATTISTTGFTPGVIKAVKLVPQDQGDDMLVLMADANLDVYSIFWDGTNNIMYASPAAKATNIHGTNGSAAPEFWFDFAWDRF